MPNQLLHLHLVFSLKRFIIQNWNHLSLIWIQISNHLNEMILALSLNFKIFKSLKFNLNFTYQIYLEMNLIHIFHKDAKLFISIQVHTSYEEKYVLVPFHPSQEAIGERVCLIKFGSFHSNIYGNLFLKTLWFVMMRELSNLLMDLMLQLY